MKIARLLKDGKETYGIIKNDKVATRQIITYETGVPLPLSIRDFLFDGWCNEIENKISDSSFQDNLKNFQLVEPLPIHQKLFVSLLTTQIMQRRIMLCLQRIL